MTTTKLQTNARAAADLFEYHQGTENKAGWTSFKMSAIQAEPELPLYRAMSDIIHEFSGSESFAYEQVAEALDAFSDCADREQCERVIDELEPDVYTSDLTRWLNLHNAHVYYLSEALSEFDPQDGFAALSWAQILAMRELYNAVLDALDN